MEGNTLMKWTNMTKVMEEYSTFVEEKMKENMKSEWELPKKIVFHLELSDNIFEITFSAPDYWKWANDGRGPGKFPPFKVINEWITRRKITPYPSSSGKLPSRRSLVFLISRKISERGTEGTHFYERRIDSYEIWKEKIINAITDDISEELDEFLSPLSIKISI